MSDESPLQNVADAERRARRRIPALLYEAVAGGSEKEATLGGNVRGFDEIWFRPRIAAVPTHRSLTTTILGQKLSLPVMIAPTGSGPVNPGAELAVARAAAGAGTALAVSQFASQPIERIVEANPQTISQLYWIGDRKANALRVERAKDAGSVALILTLDYSDPNIRRDRGIKGYPQQLGVRALLSLSPQLVTRPRFVLDFARNGGPPKLLAPNVVAKGSPAPTFQKAVGMFAKTPPPTWDDVAWIRQQWQGPFVVKGVLTVDDAKRAIDAGATAISVSNHGGMTVDALPPTIRVLPDIANAVGDQIEILLDGGIRRGGDVVKALALGAKAVLIGRAYIFGLAARGEAGVREILEILRAGIDQVLAATGCASVDEVDRSHLDLRFWNQAALAPPAE
jgi:pre-mycofactocin synthase